LKQAESGVRDYKMSAALQVANEGIISTIRKFPEKIEKIRAERHAAFERRIAEEDAKGTTIDVSKDIGPVLQRERQVLNQKGKLTEEVRNQVADIIKGVTTEIDPKGNRVPINTAALKPSKVAALTSHDGILSEKANYENGKPTVAADLARQLREVFNGKLPDDIQRMRGEESKLIIARDAAKDHLVSVLNDKYKMINGIIYGNIKYVPLWLGLKAMGLGFGEATGSIVVLKAMAENSISRSARAALYAKIANLVDGTIKRAGGPQGASGPGTAIQPQNGPQVPPAQQLTGAPGGAGTAQVRAGVAHAPRGCPGCAGCSSHVRCRQARGQPG
jgi:hypothetical protein